MAFVTPSAFTSRVLPCHARRASGQARQARPARFVCARGGSRGGNQQRPPPPLSPRDALDLWVENIMVMYGGQAPRDSAPIAEGDMSAITGGKPFFLALHTAFQETGPIYKLAFGPKVFIVVQHPPAVRSILKENYMLYDKGVLAEILEEVMGKGLIPADYETWKIRRRAIVPGFHASWLKFMTSKFAESAKTLCDKLARIDGKEVVDMETEYSSLALDIVGKAIFNYDFDSVNSESPIIKAVYRALKETEHRSMTFLPYWKFPGAAQVVPRLRKFYADMRLINDTLNTLITSAKASATALDLPELENRDYENVSDPSLLRFLVELRGEQTTNKQLRDDLMTLLIAGHETTAAVLTWATVELTKNPHIVQKARIEIDRVIGDNYPNYEDVRKLPYIRRIIAETLRLYPAPPVLIRRLLTDTKLPSGDAGEEMTLIRGTDIFINVYSLHRSPALWEKPDVFDPDRWLKPHTNPGIAGWAGYKPGADLEAGNPLYPNEANADFAFLPFGGGSRKCVGDHFAILESVVSLAMVVRRFDFALENPGEEVEMTTGATIHTKSGLNMKLTVRQLESEEGHNSSESSPISVAALSKN